MRGRVYQSPMQIKVRVVPNARKSEWLGWEDDPRAGRVVKIRLGAPPVEGKANAELRAFLARHLGVSKSRVRLLKGETSRIKTFEVDGCDELPD